MEQYRLIIVGIQLAIHVVTVFAAFDLWWDSRRRHALFAAFALSFMIIERVIFLLTQSNVSNNVSLLQIIDNLLLPFLIAISWFITILTSKRKVDK